MIEEQKICNCECHNEGVGVMHFMACCDLCYETYQSADGKFDLDLYGAAFKEMTKGHVPTLKELPDGSYVQLIENERALR